MVSVCVCWRKALWCVYLCDFSAKCSLGFIWTPVLTANPHCGCQRKHACSDSKQGRFGLSLSRFSKITSLSFLQKSLATLGLFKTHTTIAQSLYLHHVYLTVLSCVAVSDGETNIPFPCSVLSSFFSPFLWLSVVLSIHSHSPETLLGTLFAFLTALILYNIVLKTFLTDFRPCWHDSVNAHPWCESCVPLRL